MANKNKNKKKTIWLVILCIALIACIICVGVIGWYVWKQSTAGDEYENLREEVTQAQTESESKPTLEEILAAEFDGWTDGDEPELPEGARTELEENPINFMKLQDINPEIYAWVEIPNTKIDYPVAQSNSDDMYYLSHNMYGEPEFAGCIYTEAKNSKDFSDPMTVMYGHNMRNGSMFQNLHLFEDKDFFEENRYVYVYTPGHKYVYQIFASYEYDDRHIMNSFNFKDKKVFGKYIEDVISTYQVNGNIRSDVEVTAEDKILTLSTCIGGKTNSRYLVQAVLQEDDQTK